MIPKASLVCVYKISSDHTILCLSGYPNMFIVCLQYTEYENCCWPSVNIIKPNLILPRLSGSSEQHSLVGVFHKYYWNCSLPVPRPVRRSVGRLGWLVCHNFLKGRGVTLRCSYRRTCLYLSEKSRVGTLIFTLKLGSTLPQ